jgi:two-component system nitrogen regulation response regulator NtrX
MALLDVLVVDDKPDIRFLVSEILEDANFIARSAANSDEVFKLINEKVPAAMILDIWLQGSEMDGLTILEIVKKRYPHLPVVVISGHGTISTAVTAIKMGAFDYIEKPFTQEKLLIVLKRAYENSKLKQENIELKSKIADKDEMIGISQPTLKMKSDIAKIAQASSRVMIAGPVGSGKALVARLIHKQSKYSNGPFIVYNPTGILASQIHTDLFGDSAKIVNSNCEILKPQNSIIESAHNGTLYIDEIGNLPMSVQEKLLRFLQDQVIERNGKKISINTRIITSSSRNLDKDIIEGRYKEDLFYRLNVVKFEVPTLEERKEDIGMLVEYFVECLCKFSGLPYRKFSEDAIIALQTYRWPGNIRQLKNVIEWSLIMNPPSSKGDIISSKMLPPEILSGKIDLPNPDKHIDMMGMQLREAREVFEKQYLSAQMNRFNNNISKTSVFVGMERSALHRKLKLLNIHNESKYANTSAEQEAKATSLA